MGLTKSLYILIESRFNYDTNIRVLEDFFNKFFIFIMKLKLTDERLLGKR